MFGSSKFLLIFLSVCVSANQSPPTKVLKLSLSISRATYLPIDSGRFVSNGHIIENPSTSKARKLFGFIPLPPKYDPTQDRVACDVDGWTANGYEKSETEIIMFTNEQQKLVVFGFRGTEPTSLSDWESNLNLAGTSITLGQKTVVTHKGFRNRYEHIASWFESEYERIPEDYVIVLTGHSLGAAEATIAAVYAAEKLKRKPNVIVTFGSPAVGKASFKDFYEETVGCERTLRMVSENDIIPELPYNYVQVCKETKVKSGETNLIKAHSLYKGYANGIQVQFHDVDEINYGCDKIFN